MKIVILGGPGSGKKTQTGLLADHFRLAVLHVGELVKQAMAEESERGAQLRLLQQAGQSVGDDIVLGLLQRRLCQPDLGNGFILDGFPRNLLQALTLDELLDEMDLPLDFVLLFEIETDALMERLVGRRTCRTCGAVYNVYTHPTAVEDVCDLCGGRLYQRADDTEETVSSRLHVFDHLTGPLLSHYGKQGKVLRVDGEGEVAGVFARTCQAIDRFLAEQAESKTIAEAPAPPYQPAGAAVESTAAPAPAANRSKPPPSQMPANKAKPVRKGAPGGKTTGKKSPAQERPTAVATRGAAKAKSAGTAKQSAKVKSQPRPVTAKRRVDKKGADGQPPAAPKKAAAGKAAKSAKSVTASAAKRGGKTSAQPAVKTGTKKKPPVKKAVAKKTAKKVTKKVAKKVAKKVVKKAVKKVVKKVVKKAAKKKTSVKRATAGKAAAGSVAKQRSAKKVVKKKPAKKAPVKKTPAKKSPAQRTGSAKTKPVARKKVVSKQSAAKKPTLRKVAAKPKASRPGVKKKSAGKPKAGKTANKRPAKKGAKASSARR